MAVTLVLSNLQLVLVSHAICARYAVCIKLSSQYNQKLPCPLVAISGPYL